MFAGDFAPEGWALCDGSVLPVSGNQALFKLIGRTYGGDANGFALPDFTNAVPTHESKDAPIGTRLQLAELQGAKDTTRPELALTFLIALADSDYGPLVGEVIMFSGDRVPTDYSNCNGAKLPISRDNDVLFSLIGNRFGGDGRRDFALPDLRGKVPAGAADEVGSQTPARSIAKGAVRVRYLNVAFLICRHGIYPARPNAK